MTAPTGCLIRGGHPPEAGLLVCRAHFDQLADWLLAVEREAGDLDAAPSMQATQDGRGGSLAFQRAPARVDAIVLRDRRWVPPERVDNPAGFDRRGMMSVYWTLHSYAMRVRESRSLPVNPPLSVKSERQLLSRHLDWVATQPWVDGLWASLRELHRQLQEVNGTGISTRIPGTCPIPVGEGECGGRLRPVRPRHSTGTWVRLGDAEVRAVECERDHAHRWDDAHLIRLSLMLDEQQRRGGR